MSYSANSERLLLGRSTPCSWLQFQAYLDADKRLQRERLPTVAKVLVVDLVLLLSLPFALASFAFSSHANALSTAGRSFGPGKDACICFLV